MSGFVVKKEKVYSLIMFIIILFSHDTLLFGTNANNLYVSIRKIVPFILCIALFLLGIAWHRTYKIKLVCIGLLVLSLPIISCIVNREAWDNYIYRFAIMLCALLMILNGYKEQACKDYCSIMRFLSVWSLGVFIIANAFPNLLARFPIITNTQGIRFANALFSVATSSRTYGIMRNQCIFREPGVFVVFLTIAFIIEILKGDPKTKTRYIVLFTIAMLTTFSTAGYIVLAALYVYLILLNKELKKKKLVIIIVILVSLIILITQTDFLKMDSAIFNKFAIGSNSYGSWFARLSSLTENIKIAIKNPIFGVGRYSLYGIVLAENGKYIAVDNTNTILIGLAAYGFLFGILMIIGCWNFIRDKKQVLLFDLFLLIVLLMALSNEDLGQNIMFYFIVFYGISNFSETIASRRKNNEICAY